MAIKIETVSDNEITANGKTLYRDGNGKWVTTAELTSQESDAVQQYLRSYGN